MLGALRIKTAITLLLLGVELSYVYAFVTPPVSAISKKFTSFATPAPAAAAEVGLPRVADISYSEQYDAIFGDSGRGIAGAAEGKALPKPSPHAQSLQPGAKRIPFSTVYGVKKRPWFLGRSWGPQDRAYGVFFPSLHLACLAFAPRTFSPGMLGLAFAMYVICGCLGITMTYHRMLAHRAFRVPKWLEYIVAYCGAWAVQGDPVTWCSDHRYHHTSTDTPLDPHSPYEGFWHSHMGWMFDEAAHDERCTTKSNASDLSKQPFYRHLSKWYPLHVSLKFLLMFLLFGFPGLVWGGAVSTVFLWHVTFFVNSACHLWGYQPFATGDQSRNNWWVGLLAFGEGWHNLHHGYAFSARHGIFKGELDVTWMIISLLQKLGLAKDVKLPTKKQIDRMLVKDFDRELAFTPS